MLIECLMAICDFNVKRVTALPFETDAPLIVNSDAVLSFAIAAKFFKSVCRWNTQVLQIDCIVDHAQFSQSNLLDFWRQFARTLATIDLLCFGIFEGLDHRIII